jgi:hypothetical protein
MLNLVVHIRDFLDSIGEYPLASVEISSNFSIISNLLKKSVDQLKTNPLIQRLLTGSQNEIGQTITLISSQLHQINKQTMGKATSSKRFVFIGNEQGCMFYQMESQRQPSRFHH